MSETASGIKKSNRRFQSDLIVDMIEEPIVFAITIGGVWYGLMQLHFAEVAKTFIDRGVEFLLVVSITWFIARLLDAIFQNYLLPLAEKSETATSF